MDEWNKIHFIGSRILQELTLYSNNSNSGHSQIETIGIMNFLASDIQMVRFLNGQSVVLDPSIFQMIGKLRHLK